MKNFSIILLSLILLISCKKNTSVEADVLRVIEGNETLKQEKTIAIIKSVAAKSGLNYRESPKGKVISKFKYKTEVTIVEKTGVTEEIKDGNDLITGEWVGIQHNDKVVYVFDGFLSEPIIKKAQEIFIKNPVEEAMLQGYIIMPGAYHKEEIPDGMVTENWTGIFKQNKNYTVEKTAVNISKVHDAVVDNKGKSTGKKIRATNAKDCFLLMNNIAVTERSIDTIATNTIIIHPEKPYKFQFKNIDYVLSAVSKSYDALNQDETHFNAKGYELYLEKKENGVTKKQLLLFEKNFEDQMTKILFIGDIDGDHIPDVLLDSSNHYNSTVPTLYLSKEAKEGELLKIVSLHRSVGC